MTVSCPATSRACCCTFARTGLVHRERPLSDRRAVQRQDRRLGRFRCRHCDKGEPAWPPALSIERQMDLRDGSVGAKQVLQIAFARREGQVPYIQFRVHDDLTLD